MVCKHCNNGWMSQLQTDAKPILLPSDHRWSRRPQSTRAKYGLAVISAVLGSVIGSTTRRRFTPRRRSPMRHTRFPEAQYADNDGCLR
jgi:hypothetical protein